MQGMGMGIIRITNANLISTQMEGRKMFPKSSLVFNLLPSYFRYEYPLSLGKVISGGFGNALRALKPEGGRALHAF